MQKTSVGCWEIILTSVKGQDVPQWKSTEHTWLNIFLQLRKQRGRGNPEYLSLTVAESHMLPLLTCFVHFRQTGELWFSLFTVTWKLSNIWIWNAQTGTNSVTLPLYTPTVHHHSPHIPFMLFSVSLRWPKLFSSGSCSSSWVKRKTRSEIMEA